MDLKDSRYHGSKMGSSTNKGKGELLPQDRYVKEIKCAYQPSQGYGTPNEIQDRQIERGEKFLKAKANKDY